MSFSAKLKSFLTPLSKFAIMGDQFSTFISLSPPKSPKKACHIQSDWSTMSSKVMNFSIHCCSEIVLAIQLGSSSVCSTHRIKVCKHAWKAPFYINLEMILDVHFHKVFSNTLAENCNYCMHKLFYAFSLWHHWQVGNIHLLN